MQHTAGEKTNKKNPSIMTLSRHGAGLGPLGPGQTAGLEYGIGGGRAITGTRLSLRRRSGRGGAGRGGPSSVAVEARPGASPKGLSRPGPGLRGSTRGRLSGRSR